MQLQRVCPACQKPIVSLGDAITSCPVCQSPLTVLAPLERETLPLPAETSRSETATLDLPSEKITASLPSGDTSAELPLTIGRFQIQILLGEGAFGFVYRAYDPQLDRLVALKVAKPGTLTTPERVQRFLREAKSAANLRHPNIVPLFETGRDGERYFIASAFIQGRTLESLLEQGLLPLGTVAQLTRKLAEALAYAHSQGVIHRDVKPANIMIDDQGEPLLLDFGLAARAEAGEEKLTQEGVAMGTPAYMSPEQAKGESDKVGPAADQYSLGCTLYEMLIGRTPFSGGPAQQMFLHQTKIPPNPRSVRREIPRDLDTVNMKCLEKEPGHRFPNCQSLADDLRRWVDGEPIAARRAGPFERLVKWARRNPGLAASVTVAVIALLGGAGVSIYYAVRSDQNADTAQRNEQLANNNAAAERERAGQLIVAIDDKDAALTDALRNLSQGNILLAQNAWNDNGTAEIAQAQIEMIPTRFRNFEWHFLKRKFEGGLFTLLGHSHTITCLALSDDGTRIVSGSEDKTVRVWDARTGSPLLEMKGHTDNVYGVAISTDGKWIASSSSDKTVRIWDARTGRQLQKLLGHNGAVMSVVFSIDGSRLVSAAHDQIICVWNTQTWEGILQLKGHTQWIQKIAISGDGTRIASASHDRTVRVWDAQSGKPLQVMKGHTSWVQCVAISSDGARVVSGGQDNTVRVWDTRTGQQRFELKGHTDYVQRVAISGDGQQIVSVSNDRTVRIWDSYTGQEVCILKGRMGNLHGVAISVDGTRIVSSSDDRTARLWDAQLEQGNLVLKGHAKKASAAAICENGNLIVSGSEDKIVRVWDAQTGLILRELKGHTDGVACVAISKDGTRIVSGSWDETLRVWDAHSGNQLFVLKGHRNAVLSVAISEDGTRIVSGSIDRSVRVWELKDGAPLFELKGHDDWVTSVAISSDLTRIVSGSTDRKVRVWDVQNRSVILELKGHQDSVWSVAISRDRSRIVSGSEDKTIRIWNAETGQSLIELKGHTAKVTSVGFNHDGSRIVSGSVDKTVRVWDVSKGQGLLELKGHADEVTSVCFSDDDTRIISASVDKSVRVWDTRVFAMESTEEILRRRWLTRPDPDRHIELRKRFEAEKKSYAAALHRSFEHHAHGVVAFDNNQFDRAFSHFIAAAVLKPPVPKAPEMMSKD